MISAVKEDFIQNIKNIYGWKTKRRIVAVSVDDYGNVRLASKQARANMDKAGLKANNRFDEFDTLETRVDLEMLFDALSSVKDKNGKNAVFTPFALPCNINFEAMAENGYDEYLYEPLPETFEKLEALDPAAYGGAWALLKEGIAKGLIVPQFHGREHLNLKVFKEKLAKKDPQLLTALKNRSYTSITNSGYPTINISAAFEFWDFEENKAFEKIISEGLAMFEQVYGYKAEHFMSPGGREHPVIHQYLKDNGIKYIDTAWIKEEHQGHGKYKKILNHTGKKNHLGQTYMVRNVLFEPTKNHSYNTVGAALRQVEAAFRWNKPAIISSHRVNFCGHIDPANRDKGIGDLKLLLKKIVERWPDVEFMAANEVGNIITGK